jgi:hypothetical protein
MIIGPTSQTSDIKRDFDKAAETYSTSG